FLTYQDKDNLNISFNSISDDEVTLKLIDLYGNELKLLNERLTSGEYTIKKSLNSISQGFYILNLNQGIINKTIKIIVK
ncbi:MAG: T9SS type A sorting domain-containing protein, partial [Candidatus Kapabacteria bacterium]|nr:T9SS type A sorting domain-containing protein [Candidatus Kapabacteria bacterium]